MRSVRTSHACNFQDLCKWKSARPTTSRKAGYAPDFYIIVSTAGAQAETTRAIEVNPDDYIKQGCMDYEAPPCILVLAIYAKRSVQEKVWGFIDTFEDLNAVSNKM